MIDRKKVESSVIGEMVKAPLTLDGETRKGEEETQRPLRGAKPAAQPVQPLRQLGSAGYSQTS